MNWIKKSIVIAVTVLTFGAITPTHDIWNNLWDEKSSTKQDEHMNHVESIPYEYDYQIDGSYTKDLTTDWVEAIKSKAYEKFGEKIGPVIGQEFDTIIFPKMDEVIRTHIPEVTHLAITEQPSGQYAEKIFHVQNKTTEKDVIRFHVRTDKRPQEGYFFNFHYHLAEDQFSTHYELGDIFWSKNQPPKWLS